MEMLLSTEQMDVVKFWVSNKTELHFGSDPGTAKFGCTFMDPKKRIALAMNINVLVLDGKKYDSSNDDFLIQRASKFVRDFKPLFNLTTQAAVERMEHEDSNPEVKQFGIYIRDAIRILHPMILMQHTMPQALRAFNGTQFNGSDKKASYHIRKALSCRKVEQMLGEDQFKEVVPRFSLNGRLMADQFESLLYADYCGAFPRPRVEWESKAYTPSGDERLFYSEIVRIKNPSKECPLVDPQSCRRILDLMKEDCEIEDLAHTKKTSSKKVFSSFLIASKKEKKTTTRKKKKEEDSSSAAAAFQGASTKEVKRKYARQKYQRKKKDPSSSAAAPKKRKSPSSSAFLTKKKQKMSS